MSQEELDQPKEEGNPNMFAEQPTENPVTMDGLMTEPPGNAE